MGCSGLELGGVMLDVLWVACVVGGMCCGWHVLWVAWVCRYKLFCIFSRTFQMATVECTVNACEWSSRLMYLESNESYQHTTFQSLWFPIAILGMRSYKQNMHLYYLGDGINMVVVGVTSRVDKGEMTAVASSPTDQFLVDDFSDLTGITLRVVERIQTIAGT